VVYDVDSGAITPSEKNTNLANRPEDSNHEKKHQDDLQHVAPLLFFKDTRN